MPRSPTARLSPIFLLLSSCSALQPSLLHRATAPTRATPPLASAASLRAVRVAVAELEQVQAFYTHTLGLRPLEQQQQQSGLCMLGSEAEAALKLELSQREGAAYTEAGGYRGLSARVPDVAAAVEVATANGGTVLKEPAVLKYGPSQVPDEEDETVTPIMQALVADPAGYPLLLYQDPECEGRGELSAARIDVTAWKPSEAWWCGLGFSTLRWQSNLPLEASITVTVGSEGATTGIPGPLGGSGSVLQLRYVYSSPHVTQPGGLEAIMLEGASNAESEPDGYPVVFGG